MKEKTLLAEIEKEQKKKIEEQFLEHKTNHAEPEKTIIAREANEVKEVFKVKRENTINPFSAKAFNHSEGSKELLEKRALQSQQQEVADKKVLENKASNNSLVIERPNYDFIETLSPEQKEKIFDKEEIKEEERAKPKTNKFKLILVSILFAIFGVWGIVNITTLDTLGSQVSQAVSEYNINLLQYLNNLYNLDATNAENMENLFQTIPKEEVPVSSIGEQSNWFDRFCNFIAGLFGG